MGLLSEISETRVPTAKTSNAVAAPSRPAAAPESAPLAAISSVDPGPEPEDRKRCSCLRLRTVILTGFDTAGQPDWKRSVKAKQCVRCKAIFGLTWEQDEGDSAPTENKRGGKMRG
jgi:hypothetical protein